MSEDRYKVVEGSQSAHCCFDFTVVDTSEPTIINGKHFDNQYESVCECFTAEDAEMIAKALNAALRDAPTEDAKALNQ